MIGFLYEGLDIDLLFAQLDKGTVPRDLDILDDKILACMDDSSALTLNGPRTTDLIMQLVPNQKNFLTVLRCVRIWAKRRGIYGNKIGFLGGVNWSILVAFVCKLQPNAAPGKILRKFFWWMKHWKWPMPLKINNIHDAGLKKKVWDPKKDPRDGKDLMPIITPSYPAFNSSFNVTKSTRDMMKELVMHLKFACY